MIIYASMLAVVIGLFELFYIEYLTTIKKV